MKIVYRVVLITFLFFFSCDTNSTEYSEKDVFRINRYDNVSSLDPAFAKNQANTWMVNLIFNGLVKLNNQLEIEGDIAKDWDVSSDGRVYRFVLRKNVFFKVTHTGIPYQIILEM